MCDQLDKVKKVYEEFVVKTFDSSLSGIKYETNELIFEAINFNSGLLSFEDQVIECSIGSNKLKTFSKNDPENTETIEYKNVKKFKFVDCKFSNDTYFKKGLDSLVFENCIFDNRCYINNQYEGNSEIISIKNIEIKKTVFNENFKLHNTIIDYFNIVDTDFIKNADFFKSEFKSGIHDMIYFNAINFHELALFGNTIFYQYLQFKYVTFKGYTHFRSAYFHKGFDLEYANIEKEMNFFDVEGLDNQESKMNTSQETYRIIKYQLHKVGNIIDSNKYNALELTKYRESIEIFPVVVQTKEYYNGDDKKSFQYETNIFNFKNFITKVPLIFHWITSNHSQNWILPLFWIFLVGFMTYWSLQDITHHCCNNSFKEIFKYISIINFDDCIKQYPIVFVLNKVSLGYLYYQFLTAIRKDTRK